MAHRCEAGQRRDSGHQPQRQPPPPPMSPHPTTTHTLEAARKRGGGRRSSGGHQPQRQPPRPSTTPPLPTRPRGAEATTAASPHLLPAARREEDRRKKRSVADPSNILSLSLSSDWIESLAAGEAAGHGRSGRRAAVALAGEDGQRLRGGPEVNGAAGGQQGRAATEHVSSPLLSSSSRRSPPSTLPSIRAKLIVNHDGPRRHGGVGADGQLALPMLPLRLPLCSRRRRRLPHLLSCLATPTRRPPPRLPAALPKKKRERGEEEEEVRKEGKERGDDVDCLTCGVHVGPMLIQPPRQIKPG
uniref:Uncharacterized protein n=1 Tax=Oryza glumipatula TaxID=40148 RepID=A0A0D9YKS5_9ORYZ